MCNCIDESLEIIKEREISILPESADKSTLSINFKHRFIRASKKGNDLMLCIEYSYFNNKRDGTRYKNKTTGKTHLEMSYCPMCGEKYV